MNSEENGYYSFAEAGEGEEEQSDVKDYSILKEKDIIKLQNLDFSIVSQVLDVPKSVPCSLLRYYKWNIDEACDQWFTDQNELLESAGLYKLKKKKKKIEILSTNKHTTCIICFEDFKPSFMISSNACGEHYFCPTCWRTYISLSIKEGGHGSCLNLRCPEPSCKAIVDLDIIDSPTLSLSNKDKEKYCRQVRRSYTEDSVKRKWCTGPGCEFVVQVDNGLMIDKYDVTCRCSNKFCWNCNEESHRPVDCKRVEAWYSITNKFSESENINWKLANTKPCPKCKRPIEKNQGCSHITCAEPCKFQFCWICLREWFGLHVCSIATSTTTNPSNGNRETPVEEHKTSSDRFLHYYERWAINHNSMRTALDDLKVAEKKHIQKLATMHKLGFAQLHFVTEAWKQIVECRRILKWSYVYGYYNFISENEKVKKNFFEFMQREAESFLEKLFLCAKGEILQYLSHRISTQRFMDYLSKLNCLTETTQKLFESFIRALENGLSEVECEADRRE